MSCYCVQSLENKISAYAHMFVLHNTHYFKKLLKQGLSNRKINILGWQESNFGFHQ